MHTFQVIQNVQNGSETNETHGWNDRDKIKIEEVVMRTSYP
jgi:hypothetical protein